MSGAVKKFLGLLVFLFTLGIALLAGAGYWAAMTFRAAGPLQEAVILEIPKGSSLNTITYRLHDLGAIEHPLLFKLGARVMDAQSALQAGEYEITAGMGMAEIVNMLRSGKVVQRFVTVKEGLTSHEILDLLGRVSDLEQDMMGDIPEEGSLLPETYSYARGDSAGDILARMEAAMRTTLDELWESRTENLPFETKEEALTLASIVEKETAVADERARVAGVFINRLRRGIALQTDPTVIYALTEGQHENEGKGPLGRRLLKKDLEFDSPYNTYKYPGLPPGPIANPGRASIKAALHPEEHDFIYFVADGTGGHVFAKTLEEHNRNVAAWRKIRKNQGK